MMVHKSDLQPARKANILTALFGWMSQFRRNPAGSAFFVFCGLQIICVIAWIFDPEGFRYLTAENIEIILRSMAPLAIIAIGVAILMIAGEFDLSVGAVFTFSSIMMATALEAGAPALLAVGVGLGCGIFVGVLNALVVLHLRITSFIATLGMMMMLRGLILFMSGAQTKTFESGEFLRLLFAGDFGFVQSQFLWAVVLAAVAYYFLERHRAGNHIYAVGGAEEAANAVGIRVKKVKMLAFCVSSLTASIAGIISTIRVQSISPVQGQGYELQAIAACVIGGVALQGGRGSIAGAFIGAALIYTVQDVLLLSSVPGYYLDAFVGLFIVFAAVLNRRVYRQD